MNPGRLRGPGPEPAAGRAAVQNRPRLEMEVEDEGQRVVRGSLHEVQAREDPGARCSNQKTFS